MKFPPRPGPTIARAAKPPADPLWWPARLTESLTATGTAEAKLYFIASPPDGTPELNDQVKEVYLLPGQDPLAADADVLIQYHAQHKRWYAHRGGLRHVAFELAGELTVLSGTPADAYERDWSPSANGGWGGFATNMTKPLKVADWREIGYYGHVGAYGAAEIWTAENGEVGVIFDLQCPSDYYPYYPQQS